MKLVERYALAAGLKIGKQFVLEQFCPLPFTKYITLHASSGANAAKNYPLYGTVVEAIKPYLAARGIEIVQLGVKDDLVIPGCHHMMGKYSFGQGSYLLRSSLLHLGNDSVWGHRAGYLGIPLVQPWGPTAPENHSSYEADPAKTIHLISHRWGRKPSFAAQENPLSIALIDPYDVARAVLKLLDIPHTITQRTQFVGGMYGNPVIEWIPDAVVDPRFNPGVPFVARMDKHHDENNLAQLLQTGRKIHLFAKQPLANLGILQAFKDSILSYSHELTPDCPIQYVRAVKTALPKASFFSRLKDDAELSKLRFHFLDHTLIERAVEQTREDYVRESTTYLNEDAAKTLDRISHIDRLEFKTNKYVLSNGAIYPSYAHLAAKQPLTDAARPGLVIDSPDFWIDLHHLLIYTP